MLSESALIRYTQVFFLVFVFFLSHNTKSIVLVVLVVMVLCSNNCQVYTMQEGMTCFYVHVCTYMYKCTDSPNPDPPTESTKGSGKSDCLAEEFVECNYTNREVGVLQLCG